MTRNFIVLLCLFLPSCKTRQIKENVLPRETSSQPISSQEVQEAVEGFSFPDVFLDSFKLGPLSITRLNTNILRGSQNHYKYKFCKQGSEDCPLEGKIFWGSALFPSLDAGVYDVYVSSCLQDYNFGREFCDKELQWEWKQDPYTNKVLYTMLMEQVRYTQEIKSEAYPYYESLENYLKTLSKLPEDVLMTEVNNENFDLVVRNLVDYGPDFLSEMINSSYYYELFLSTSENQEDLESTKTTDAEDTDVESTDVEEKSGKSYGEKTKNLLAPVLITIGIPFVLLGVVVEGLSWYVPPQINRTVDSLKDSAFGKIESVESVYKDTELLQKILSAEDPTQEVLNYLESINGTEEEKMAKARSLEERLKRFNIVGNAADIVRKKVYGVFSYTNPATVEILKKKHGTSFRKTSETDDYTRYDMEGKTFIVEKVPGEVEGSLVDGKVYELNSGLLKVKFPEGKIPKSPKDIKTIRLTKEEYLSLNPSERVYFAKSKNSGNYEWIESREDSKFTTNYLVLDGAVYRKEWIIDDESIMPKLNEKTIEKLKKRYSIAVEGTVVPELNKKNYGLGVPLIDEDGRLVEPPELWKVSGVNWPTKGKPLEYRYEGQKITISIEDLEDSTKVFRNPAKGSWAAWAVNPLQSIEIPLRTFELKTKADVDKQIGELVVALDEYAKTGQSSLRDFDTHFKMYTQAGKAQLDTHSKNIKKSSLDYGAKGKFLGGALILTGLAAVGGGLAVGYSLAGDTNPRKTLLDETRAREEKVALLHKEREVKALKIDQWLSSRRYEVPRHLWIYHLNP